jgi:hypothetical protein
MATEIHVRLNVLRGSVTVHLSRKMPSDITIREYWKKLANCDDENQCHVNGGDVWEQRVSSDPGNYVVDLPEWKDASVTLLIEVKGVQVFYGEGDSPSINDWTQKHFDSNASWQADRQVRFSVF